MDAEGRRSSEFFMSKTIEYKAIGDRVISEREQRPEITQTGGGIFIPEIARAKYAWAKVLAVGEKVKDVKPGDRVMLHRLVGVENDTEHNGRHLVFSKEHEILAVEVPPFDAAI